ncbi:DUF721 domain-containing protein [Verrucomicrobium sp. BvORR034]|jgi:hypothetical protein|uniref:DUF721 domain-containing protein n=1 Tax=Verrucomicrobium sp. BvORR034 TaxID=1396418 RepID=UPI0006796190|nr:DUF721 domain-containing protein [Verrucomicrobium sp. BvORR034]
MRYATRQQRLRHDLITKWRGLEGEPLNELPTLDVGHLIPSLLKEWKLDEQLREDDVAAAWQEIVGEFISRHTAPDGIKRGVLTLRVLQPAIHHTLMMEKGTLLRKLQERFGSGTIRDIRFRHG